MVRTSALSQVTVACGPSPFQVLENFGLSCLYKLMFSSGRRVRVARQEHISFTPIGSECCHLGLVNAIKDPFLDVNQHIPEVYSDFVSREKKGESASVKSEPLPWSAGLETLVSL